MNKEERLKVFDNLLKECRKTLEDKISTYQTEQDVDFCIRYISDISGFKKEEVILILLLKHLTTIIKDIKNNNTIKKENIIDCINYLIILYHNKGDEKC